jgi:hypothetical protein
MNDRFFRISQEVLDKDHTCLKCAKTLSKGTQIETFGVWTESNTGLYYTFCNESCRMRWLICMFMIHPNLYAFTDGFEVKKDE